MKRILIVSVLLILASCNKDDNTVLEIDNNSLNHAELGFELDEPDIILNELAFGKLDRNINSVLRQMFDNFPEPVEKYWGFDYIENSDRISKMTFYSPHYSDCEKDIFQFYYNSQNLIKTVTSTRTNLCNVFEVIKTYTFNYNQNGLLKSVYMDNDYFVEENYFSYYPNGKIKEIYNDFRNGGTEPDFGVQKFYYDSTYTNVIKVEHTRGFNYSYTYQYFYDNKINPYKDFFIAVSVFMPYIGPSYLSGNNVIKMIEKNENNIYGNEFTYEYLFNYSNINQLESYSDKDEAKFPYILYSINQ
jgi:hypothetical protein